MLDDVIKGICKKLKPVLGKRADALWLAYVSAETPQLKREMEALIQMCGAQYLSNAVDDGTILLPPPSAIAAQGEFALGDVIYRNRMLYPLGLTRQNFIRQICILAITGAGKTNVAQLLLLGLLKEDIPFLVVDWKRSYRAIYTLADPKVENIKLYTIGRKTAAFSWNPLRAPPGVHPKTWISVVAEALEKSHISGPGVADIFIEILDKKFEEFGCYTGVPEKLPNFFDVQEELSRMQLKGRRMLWQDSCARIVKTFIFGPASGAFNARNPLKIEDLLTLPVILELDQELPKPLRVFFSDVLLRWIHLYRLGQGESEELRHVTFLEEVHNLFPKTNIEKQATNSLENVFREIRGFGEGLVSITQHPSLMPVYILGNSSTQIYLSLQHEDDIITAKRALFLEYGEEVFLERLTVGEGIVKIKGRVGPCHVRFPRVPIDKGKVSDQSLGTGEADGETHVD